MVSKEYILDTINKNISAREEEVFGYEFNISNYEAMLMKLPGADAEHSDNPLIAAQHGLRVDLTQRILAERIQLQTAQLVLDVLRERLSA